MGDLSARHWSERGFALVLLLLCSLVSSYGQQANPALRSASAIAYDTAGNLFIADADANRVYEATLAGSLVVVAGTGVQGYAGDGGPATAAELNRPQGLAIGQDGTVYVADTANHRVRAVTSGTITTLAGTGVAGFSGDQGQAASAMLRQPTALTVEADGALLLCDTGNHRVRRVRDGLITTVAGTGKQGFGGDGGPALAATLDSPQGIVAASDGRVFIADTHNQRVRLVDSNGLIRTYAGTGLFGFAGDGASATVAQLGDPRGLALAKDGSLLIADAANRRMRMIDPYGVVTTSAGNGIEGTTLDGTAALVAETRGPHAVAVSSFGMVAVADALGGTVQVNAGSVGLYQPAALATGRTSTIAVPDTATLVYGQGAATVSVTGAVGLPQGEVRLLEGGQNLGTAPLQSGSASVDVGNLAAGKHSLTFTYAGNGLNPEAQLAGLQASVTPAIVNAVASAATVVYGAPLPALSGVLTGVLPRDAADVSATYNVSAGDLADVGTYPIVASLTGAKAGNYSVGMAEGSGRLTITKATAVAVMLPSVQAFAGLPWTVSTTLASSTRGQPTGKVQFLDGNTVIATAELAVGKANATLPSAIEGAHQISATYMGDNNFLPAASPAITVAVAALPDFEVKAAALQTVQVAQGAAATYTLTVAARPGPFTGAISLSAAGLPPGASVNFSTPQVVPGMGTATVTVTVQTADRITTAFSSRHREGSGLVLAASCVLCFGFRRRRDRLRLVCTLLCSVALTGCGARSVGEGLDGVLSRSYTLQVTGTATNLAGQTVTHSVPLTLTLLQ